MKKNLFLFLCLFLLGGLLNLDAQIKTPAASPGATFTQSVGLSEVIIEYSRPNKSGRTIFAEDGLVPFGKLWRTGANAATKITFSDDVKVNGSELGKGSYALLTIPGAASWTINLYNYESSNWGSYTDKEPALSTMAKPIMFPEGVEVSNFLINIAEIKSGSAIVELIWDNIMVPVGIEFDVDKRVMASIEQTLSGPTPNDYYNAASYYHDSGKDLKEALTMIRKATSVESPRFWQVRKEALILADLGMTKEAIKVAEKSIALAKEAGNDDYVRNNQKSIAEWSMKK